MLAQDDPQVAVDVLPVYQQSADHQPADEPAAAPEEDPDREITEELAAALALDDDLEDGWRAAMPSARFVAAAIAYAGAGLIIAGLAMRFQP